MWIKKLLRVYSVINPVFNPFLFLLNRLNISWGLKSNELIKVLLLLINLNYSPIIYANNLPDIHYIFYDSLYPGTGI